MKTFAIVITLLLSAQAPALFGAEVMNAKLRQGLFEEEGNHNYEAAIQAYEAVVVQHEDQRRAAATALFRVGECYRKLGRTNEAVAQYQRLLRDFADQTNLVTLSRQNLAGLGARADASARADSGHSQDRLQRIVRAAPSDVAAPTDEEEREVRRIQALIQDSPDLINSPGADGLTPLHHAARAGQLRVARYLLSSRADVNARKKSSPVTPLHLAADAGHRSMCELLLTNGADLSVQGKLDDAQQGTALHVAAGHGFKSVVELLLASKADVGVRNEKGRTPLHFAALAGHRPVAELLLDNGASVNARDASDETPLHVAAQKGHQDMVKLLLARKAPVDATAKDGTTPLGWAVTGGHLGVAATLLASGASVNVKSPAPGGDPLLHMALTDRERLGLLLAHKPNLELLDRSGFDPLQRSVFRGVDGESLKMLLAAGANPNAVFSPVAGAGRLQVWQQTFQFLPATFDVTGCSPLMVGVLREQLGLVEALLAGGADVNAKAPDNFQGNTALHFAVERRSLPLVTALLTRRPELEAQTQRGLTPLLLAVSNGDAKIAEALLKAGAQVEATFSDGNSALHQAVRMRRMDLIELLLAHQANPNALSKAGQTPLTLLREAPADPKIQAPPIAFQPGQPPLAAINEIAALLLKHGANKNTQRRSFITLTRKEHGWSKPWLFQGTNDWNRYSLLDLIASFFADTTDSFERFAFPDFANVKIKRLDPKGGTDIVRSVDLATLFKTGDCSGDLALEWGDVVDIPELDHGVNDLWAGLPKECRDTLQKCLKREVEIVVKGERTKVVLMPSFNPPLGIAGVSGRPTPMGVASPAPSTPRPDSWRNVYNFRLKAVLQEANVLRVSSDLSRVKVKRADPAGSSTQERLFNLTADGYDARTDLWLRAGDVIEVPEK